MENKMPLEVSTPSQQSELWMKLNLLEKANSQLADSINALGARLESVLLPQQATERKPEDATPVMSKIEMNIFQRTAEARQLSASVNDILGRLRL
jgi:hypothetical protein